LQEDDDPSSENPYLFFIEGILRFFQVSYVLIHYYSKDFVLGQTYSMEGGGQDIMCIADDRTSVERLLGRLNRE
jgi:hypothetical protein